MGKSDKTTIPSIENCIHLLPILMEGFLLIGIKAIIKDPINREKQRYKSVSEK